MAFTLINTDNIGPNSPLHMWNGSSSPVNAVLDGTTYVFTSDNSGISVFSVDASGKLHNVNNVTSGHSGRSTATAAVGGTTYLYTAGLGGFNEFAIGAGGTLTTVGTIVDNGLLELKGIGYLATAVAGGTTYVFAGGSDDHGISAFSVGANGTLTNVANVSDDATLHLLDFSGVTTAVVGGATYLFTASMSDLYRGDMSDGDVSVFSVGANGALTNVSNVSDNGLHGIGAITTAEVGGATYLFAGANEGGIGVFSVGANGSLTKVAHEANGRHDTVQSITTLAIGGTTYLVVGGYNEGGISVFAVGPGGSLTNVLDVIDNFTLQLFNPHVASGTADGIPYLFVKSPSWEHGASVFRVENDLGPPVAKDDHFATTLNPVIGNVFADNGTGADTDPDNDPFVVTAINGGIRAGGYAVPGVGVGDQIGLPSGSAVILGADGDFVYYPSRATFDSLPAPGSGASNATTAIDTFTYTIAANSSTYTNATATVTVTITGVDSNDILRDSPGIDNLIGGVGDDRYYVSNTGDRVNEAVGGGNDRVFASVSYSLAAGQEIETLSTDNDAGTGAITLTGNEFNNTLIGNRGVNTLIGLSGDDRYYVGNAADVVNEAVGGGNDRVLASVSFTLAAGQEIETLSTDNDASTNLINLTGNEFNNTLIGNRGVNTLIGLSGDDRYYVSNAAGVVTEAVGGGNDRVFASVSYALAAGQEIETLSTDNDLGTNPINLTGNAFTRLILGNAGNNSLVGVAGINTMAGLGGNDSYHVDNDADVVNEAVGGGNDRVLASVSYALAAGQELETLSTDNDAGTSPINLAGNAFDNTLIGNRGDNLFDPGAGSDTVSGRGGSDTIDYAQAAGGVFVYLDYHDGVGAVDEGAAGASFRNGAAGVTVASTDYLVDISNAVGSPFDDRIYGTAGGNLIRLGAGADIVHGLGGSDTIDYSGAAGGIYVYLDYHDGIGVVEEGAAGASFRNGATGVTLASTDYLVDISNANGSAFDDRIYATAGDNLIQPGAGADVVDGLGGSDTIDYSDAAGGVFVYLDYGAGIGAVDEGTAGASFRLGADGVTLASSDLLVNFSNANGSAFDDRIYGSDSGGALNGAGGYDVVYGAAGDDRLNGGRGNDTLIGSGGNDTFVFDAALDVNYEIDQLNGVGNIDRIADFTSSTGAAGEVDLIELDHAIFGALPVGALAAAAFTTGAPTTADQHILYDAATRALSYDDDGNGAHVATQFATLITLPAGLSAADFLVI